MSVTSNATLIGLLVAAVQNDGTLVLTHDASTEYDRTQYESACGSTVFRVRFGSGPSERGRVEHVLIDGRPIVGAAETLQIRAARRGIESISIMNCGTDPNRPIFTGALNLSVMESQAAGMRWSLIFKLTRDHNREWQITID